MPNHSTALLANSNNATKAMRLTTILATITKADEAPNEKAWMAFLSPLNKLNV